MATTVYDGDGSDARGNLFEGIKFNFMHRLPTRERWMNLVKANAGQIVKLDKQADIVIADHAIKGCPAGSISWRFIEESVKDGELKDYAAYPAGPPAYSPRPVGSGQPAKKGRTPFTAEDDRILLEWVLEAESRGVATKGNELYIDLETKNNRHTAQSWRDRWIKYLSHRYRSEPSRGLPTQLPSGPRPSSRTEQPDQRLAMQSRARNMHSPPRRNLAPENRPEPQISRLQRAPASSPMNVSASKAGDTGPFVAKSAGGTEFIDEEIQLLFENGEDIMNLNEDQTINAWIAWAAEHPDHTAQEWRNCFAEVVAPRLKERAKKKPRKTSPRSEHKRVSAATPMLRASQQGSYQSTESTLRISSSEVPESQPTMEKAPPLIRREDIFRRELATVAQGLKLKVNFNPVICGKTIPLFKLWQAVWSEECGGCNEVTRRRLWPRVARTLNFNDFLHPSAAQDLEVCYREILLYLEEGEEDYETTELSETVEQEMIEDQLRNTAARETQKSADDPVVIQAESENRQSDDDLDRLLSLSREQTPTSSNKRRLDSKHGDQGASSQAWSSPKRRRVDKGKEKVLEIASTPETTSDSDNDGQPRSSHGKPQLEGTSPIVLEGLDDEGESELFVMPFKRAHLSPSPLRAVRRTLEPETQDFHFPIEPYDRHETVMPIASSFPKQTHGVSRNPARHIKVTGAISAESLTAAKEAQDGSTLDAFIDRYVALGYSELDVIRALEATTMNTGDAGIVMESLHAGTGIPNDIQGVWTSSDDEAVEEKKHARFGEVVVKHGRERVALRRRFLADQKAAKSQIDRGKGVHDTAVHSISVIE